MGCGIGMIKYLLFIFNIIFAICGIAILAVGVVIHLQLANVSDTMEEQAIFPSIALIVVGSIIFVISFFGCWGAIRENHCMTVTFAVFLLVILIIQVAVAAYAFIAFSASEDNKISITKSYRKFFENYWIKEENREVIDAIQLNFKCCGVESSEDFKTHQNFNGTIPMSCCEINDNVGHCSKTYSDGCAEQVKNFLIKAGITLGGVALGIAGIELIGIIFALCLANSIKNAQRRGYRV